MSPEIDDYAKARDVCACFNLRKASRAITQIFDNALRPMELRSGQFMLLLSVHLLEASTMKELADVLGMDRTALTRMVKPLVDRRLLRVQKGKDRRTRFVSLSPAGKGKLVESYQFWERAQVVAEKLLGVEQLGLLLGNLRTAFANITESDLEEAVKTSLSAQRVEPAKQTNGTPLRNTPTKAQPQRDDVPVEPDVSVVAETPAEEVDVVPLIDDPIPMAEPTSEPQTPEKTAVQLGLGF